MELIELRNNIKNSNINKYYIFAGPEHVIKRAYISLISETTGKEIEYTDSFFDIKNSLNSKSLLLKPKCYVVYNDASLIKNEALWKYIDNMTANNIVIFDYQKLDSKLKFVQTYEKNIINFDYLSETILEKYIKRDYKLNSHNAQRLINRCDCDYGKIQNYGKCISCLSMVDHISADEAFTVLINENQIPISLQSAEKEILDYILRGSFRSALECYELFKESINIIYLISMIYNSIKNIMLVQSCYKDKVKDIAGKTGLDNWAIKSASNYVNYFSISDLVYILTLLRTCETGLKNGLLEESQIMSYFLLQVC